MLTYFRCSGGEVQQLPEFRADLLTDDPATVHWIDLEDPTGEEALVLEEPFHFHPLAIEDCLSEVHHPKVDDYDSYVFIVVHGVRFDAPSDRFVTRALNIFLGSNYLVTHHWGALPSVTETREQCAKRLTNAMPKGADFLTHQILDRVFERYFPNLDAIEDKIQLVQVEVFERPTQETLDRIFGLKRDVLHLRRTCAPQRDIVARLARGEFKQISAKAAIYFRDIYDNLYRIVEASFSYQDMTQGILDAYLSAVSNRLNETVKRLTVIGALLMPLTVITGVYGMNFRHMPELGWRYGYFGILGFMAAVCAGLLYWFKRKEWI